MKFIDFRSDTVTWPTDEMRRVMVNAQVGDDVYGDDPTTIRLENLAAEMLNKEAALFVPTGTMGNQLAIFTHTNRGDEVITAEDNHIVVHEAGAPAIIAGVNLRCLPSVKGMVDLEKLKKTIRFAEDIHEPKTGLICTENAHSTGVVHPLPYMEELYGIARKNNIPVHLDGARIFNAASYLNTDASKIARYADSVVFCLSKGLCAPIGSILVGTKDFIESARRKRKILGGGMRQVGILAQAGIFALENMSKRLHVDNQNAIYLGQLLSNIPNVEVCVEDIHINMVFVHFKKAINSTALTEALKNEGILINPPNNDELRLVTHYYIGKAEIEKIVDKLRLILED